MNNKLIIIRGVPGSGKSTWAKRLSEMCQYLGLSVGHFEADMHFMHDGVYKFDGSQIGVAHKECFDNSCESMRNNAVTIVSNTFVSVAHIKPYVDYANSIGVEPIVYRCVTNSEVDWHNVHDVPENVLVNMKEHFEDIKDELVNVNNEIFVLNGKVQSEAE